MHGDWTSQGQGLDGHRPSFKPPERKGMAPDLTQLMPPEAEMQDGPSVLRAAIAVSRTGARRGEMYRY